MACWHHPAPISAQEHYPDLPAGSDESLCEEFFGYIEAKEKKWFDELGGGENFFSMLLSIILRSSITSTPCSQISKVLHYIAILPAYQGKGIGRWVIEPRLQEADLAGKKILLIGTPLAQTLYTRLGFEEVDSFEIDLEGRGLRGGNHWAVMVREPRSL